LLFTSTEQCLEATIENLGFFQAYRGKDAKTRFLNVIQGLTPQESVDR
jgi:hypothetical protein